MRRWKTILLICLIPTVLGVISLAVAVRFLPGTDLVRNHVKDALSSATGQIVSVGSVRVSLSLSNLLDLTLAGLSVTSRDGKPLLSADRVEFSPSLSALVRRQISIKSVTVRGLRVFVRRQRDGTIQEAIQATEPAPAPSRASGEPSGARPSQGVTEEKPAVLQAGKRGKSDLKVGWSVDSIKVIDARLEWIDRQIVPGQEVRISLKEVNGLLNRKGSADTFWADFTGKLWREATRAGAITLTGTLTAAPDFSRLVGANITSVAKSVNLRIFRDYIPPSARAGENFQSAGGNATIVWQSGVPARISCSARLESKTEKAQVSLQGKALVASDFGSITELEGTVETDLLPLRFLKQELPPQIPISPDQGTMRARLEGKWRKDGGWRVLGDVGIEDAIPRGALREVASKVRIWLRGSLDPARLVVKNAELADSARLATLAGTVAHPFSSARRLDLKGEIVTRSSWLQGMGLSLPKGLEIKGAFPVRFLAQGTPEDLWLDLTGDLGRSEIRWRPFLEKPAGRRATFSIKGKAHYRHGSGRGPVVNGAVVAAGMNGATIRIREQGPQLSGCAVQFDGKVALNASGPDLSDATLAIRRGSGARAILLVRANLKDVGSESMTVHGTATAALDRTALALVGLEDESGVRLSGSAPLQARFKGGRAALDWSLELPLSPLNVSIRDWFRKPGGVDGNLKASGKWAGKELILNYGQLSLPAVVVTGRGTLRDGAGRLHDLLVTTKNARLEHLAKFVPVLQNRGLTGEADLEARLTESEKGIVPKGTIRPISVHYAPKGSSVVVRQMRGLVETDGSSLEVKELTGRVSGPLDTLVTVQGSVQHLGVVQALEGSFTVQAGKGRINAGVIRSVLDKANVLLGTILDPKVTGSPDSPLDFESASATLKIHSGIAKSQDVRLKGPKIRMAAMGGMDLKGMILDATLGMKTFTVVPAVLGKIPAVKKLVKEHEGLLKAIGLNKELKRLGLDGSAPEQNKGEGGNNITKTPVTLIFKLQGPAQSPTVTPVLETTLSKGAAERLKSLMN